LRPSSPPPSSPPRLRRGRSWGIRPTQPGCRPPCLAATTCWPSSP
jgi:hypothetical protein